jgi:hypothetical protein
MGRSSASRCRRVLLRLLPVLLLAAFAPASRAVADTAWQQDAANSQATPSSQQATPAPDPTAPVATDNAGGNPPAAQAADPNQAPAPADDPAAQPSAPATTPTPAADPGATVALEVDPAAAATPASPGASAHASQTDAVPGAPVDPAVPSVAAATPEADAPSAAAPAGADAVSTGPDGSSQAAGLDAPPAETALAGPVLPSPSTQAISAPGRAPHASRRERARAGRSATAGSFFRLSDELASNEAPFGFVAVNPVVKPVVTSVATAARRAVRAARRERGARDPAPLVPGKSSAVGQPAASASAGGSASRAIPLTVLIGWLLVPAPWLCRLYLRPARWRSLALAPTIERPD